MHFSRWARIILMTNYFEMNGRRKRGRPRTRWEDDLNWFAISYGWNSWLDFAICDKGTWE